MKISTLKTWVKIKPVQTPSGAYLFPALIFSVRHDHFEYSYKWHDCVEKKQILLRGITNGFKFRLENIAFDYHLLPRVGQDTLYVLQIKPLYVRKSNSSQETVYSIQLNLSPCKWLAAYKSIPVGRSFIGQPTLLMEGLRNINKLCIKFSFW